MSRWFRHYAGMMRDDKLVRVAIRSGQSIERVTWIWGAILESAAEIDENGRFDIDAGEIAYFLRADENDVEAVISCLVDAGRIGEGAVVKWSDRQFVSDRSAERVRRHRERKKDGDTEGGETPVLHHGNDAVTLHNGCRNSPETELELETELEDSASNDADVQNEVEILLPEHVVAEWNRVAERLGKARVRDITPSRRVLLKARIAQYTIDDFMDVFGKVERSPFLRGDTGGWQGCTFDWIAKKGNFQKVLEGNYDQ